MRIGSMRRSLAEIAANRGAFGRWINTRTLAIGSILAGALLAIAVAGIISTQAITNVAESAGASAPSLQRGGAHMGYQIVF
jgi:hypothetical protein